MRIMLALHYARFFLPLISSRHNIPVAITFQLMLRIYQLYLGVFGIAVDF